MDGETITLAAQKSDGTPLPSWLRFFPSNNTFVAYPTYVQRLSVKLIAYDPQYSNATLTFSILVYNEKPQVIVK